MRGTITRRGKSSWRLKFDIARVNGERITRYATVRGKRADAEAELARMLNDAHKGMLVDPSKCTVRAWLDQWLTGKDLSPRSREQYADLINRMIAPLLGEIELQKLKPLDVKRWLDGLRGRDGHKLHPRTIRHAYRVLHGALAEAVKLDMVSRNVTVSVAPPKIVTTEKEILNASQITGVLDMLKGSRLYPIASLAVATGMRRGELLALRWRNVDLTKCVLRVEASLEQTKGSLRFKAPKSAKGLRSISLPKSAVAMLSEHRREQLEIRLSLGLGKPSEDALVFCNGSGEPISPNCLTVQWSQAISRTGLKVSFHSLRHSHASALIAAGIDVVSVSRRLGHSSPSITLDVYSHLFRETDSAAAEAIERVFG